MTRPRTPLFGVLATQLFMLRLSVPWTWLGCGCRDFAGLIPCFLWFLQEPLRLDRESAEFAACLHRSEASSWEESWARGKMWDGADISIRTHRTSREKTSLDWWYILVSSWLHYENGSFEKVGSFSWVSWEHMGEGTVCLQELLYTEYLQQTLRRAITQLQAFRRTCQRHGLQWLHKALSNNGTAWGLECTQARLLSRR